MSYPYKKEIRVEEIFIWHLKLKGQISVDECAVGWCISDVLSLNMKLKQVYEYEFKRTSHDLKVLELKKDKYRERKQYNWRTKKYDILTSKQPNRFYFVVPEDLFEKEKDYLLSLEGVGVIIWHLRSNASGTRIEFTSMKRVRTIFDNTFDFDKTEKRIRDRIYNKHFYDIEKKLYGSH